MTAMLSDAERLARVSGAQRRRILGGLSSSELRSLEFDWKFWARPNQLAPKGHWSVWLMLAGRGFGKTRSGAEWVRSRAFMGSERRIALVAPTAADVRDVMVEGESGLLAISPPDFRPIYEPSKRRLTWPNGAMATTFSADEPERLRGPQHTDAWCDEAAVWRYPEALDNLMLGLRLGDDPRAVITTTPKPVKLIRELLAAKGTVVTKGSTYDNFANLSPVFYQRVVAKYEGTRLGRQEIDAELLEDVPGALWTRKNIDDTRIAREGLPMLVRIVVAIDPAMTSGEDADETGIMVVGLARDGQVYVLEDLSGHYSPRDWARKAVDAYNAWKADRIVAETNAGGEMVEGTIRTVDPTAAIRSVVASRGKVIRAEPVAALYEQNRAHHVGSFALLEDQLCAFTTDFDREAAGYSPDRLDALVWAITDLVINDAAQGWVRHYGTLAEQARAPARPEPEPPQQVLPNVPPPPPKGNELTEIYLETLKSTAQTDTCPTCKQPVSGDYVTDGVDRWHPGCFPRAG